MPKLFLMQAHDILYKKMKIATFLQPKNCFFSGKYDEFTKIKKRVNPINKIYPTMQVFQLETNFLRKSCNFNFL